MLSAIAARKAARAAEQPINEDRDHDTQGKSSTSASESDQPLFPLPQKRKGQETEPPRKKRLKGKNRPTHTEIGRARYFDVNLQGHDDDTLAQSEGVTTVPVSRAYSPSQPVYDVEITQEEDLAGGLSTETPAPSRGFSPSRPILDSSEEEDPQGVDIISRKPEDAVSSVESHTDRHGTFIPVLDSNTFRLTHADLVSLQVATNMVHCATLVLISPGHSISFVGTASITLLHGAITVLGTRLIPSFRAHRMFSPRSSPLVSLEALDIMTPPGDKSATLLHPGHPSGSKLPQRVENALRATDSVVVIQHLATGVEGLGRVCKIFEDVFDVDSDVREGSDENIIGIPGFHLVNPHTRPHPQLQSFLMPDSWLQALDASVPPGLSPGDTALTPNTTFVGLVRGPKNCGKSTFSRTLLNRLTTRYRYVAFLECDLGQSEFTPGGMVSLHIVSKSVFGPPFTHPMLPYRAHYVGHTTPRSSPGHYLSCIQALIQTYRLDVQYAYHETLSDLELHGDEHAQGKVIGEEHDVRIDSHVPLVVNTQGWIKGLGGDLLRRIEDIIEASDVFDLDSQANVRPQQQNQPSVSRMHNLQPIFASPLTAYYTAADHRSLSILSYFHCVFPSQGSAAEQWATDLPLCAHPPWEVNCKEAISHIVLVGAGYEDVVPSELDRAINGGVVALVCEDEDTLDSPGQIHNAALPYTQGAPTPAPNTSHCVGLALIRGVDISTHRLHLLTPLPPAVFSKCRILVKGELELPIWGMLDFREGQEDGVAGVKWGKVPYLQMGGGGTGAVGGGRKKVRRNLMRRGQI